MILVFVAEPSLCLCFCVQVGNTILIVFLSFLGSRVHRPRYIGGGALLACLASLLMALPHFLSGPYDFTDRLSSEIQSSFHDNLW